MQLRCKITTFRWLSCGSLIRSGESKYIFGKFSRYIFWKRGLISSQAQHRLLRGVQTWPLRFLLFFCPTLEASGSLHMKPNQILWFAVWKVWSVKQNKMLIRSTWLTTMQLREYQINNSEGSHLVQREPSKLLISLSLTRILGVEAYQIKILFGWTDHNFYTINQKNRVGFIWRLPEAPKVGQNLAKKLWVAMFGPLWGAKV